MTFNSFRYAVAGVALGVAAMIAAPISASAAPRHGGHHGGGGSHWRGGSAHWHGGGGPHWRVGRYNHYRGYRGYGYYDDSGAWVAGTIFGLAAGAMAAGAANSNSVAYCEQRFRSYDPASGTYLGYDGVRHPCP